MKNRLYTTALSLLIALLALPATAATSTRSSSFEYDAESGLLTKEIIEPDDSKLCLVTEYEYDSKFGNKISVTTRNCDGRAGEAAAPSAAPASVNATLAYSCPSGSTLSGTDCIAGAIPTTVAYSCPAGYTRSGTSCTLTIAATAVYGCLAGYMLSGTTCSHTVTATYNPQTVLFNMTDGGSFTRTVQTNKCTSLGGTVNWASQCVKLAYYSCPSDYTLSGTSCTTTEPATASPSCPAGQTLSGTNCTAIVAATIAYSCATNYTLTGTTCFGTATPASSAYNCPEGQTLSGTLCLTNANDAVIASRTTRNTFDARGQFAETTTNALNHTETRTFDPRFGAITRLTGPNGLITTWTYDGFGRKKTETRADNTSTAWEYLVGNINGALDNGALYANIKYTILTQIKDSAGVLNAGMSTYDYYDLLGRKLVSSRRNFTDTTWIDEGRVEYDALGRVVKSYLPHERNQFSSTSTLSATVGYDLLGRPLVQTAADGSRVEMQYAGLVQTVYQAPDINTTNKLVKTTTRNVLGQTAKVVDALGYQLTYTYDTFGNLLTTTDHAGNVTQLSYDARGRKSKMIDPDMGTWFYYYNALGELIRQKDAKNQTVTMTYDVLGRMLSRSEPGLNSTWVYDTAAYGKGKLTRASTDNGYSRTHSYDIKGRLSATSTIIGNTVTAYVTGVTYDTFGRVDVQTYPTGFAVKNKYSGAGYLTSVVNNATQTTAYWTANSMDAAGHLLEQTYHNGLKITQGFYETTGRLKTQQALDANAAKRQDMNYTYDTLGNLKTRNDGVNGLGELFSYDDLNRLENATVNSGGINAMTSVAYSAIGNITRKTLLTTAVNGAQTLSDAGNYTYNPSGANSIRPHAVTGITQATAADGITNTTGMLNGRANPTFTYDANGNMLTGAGRTIAWTSFNIPSQITSCPPDATGTACKTTRFVYNSEHERTTEYLADGSTVHVLSPRYDTGLHFEKRVKVDGSIEYEHYLYAGGLMFGKYVTHTNAAGAAIQSTDMAGTQRSRVIEYYLKDHLGSITAQVNGDPNPALLPSGTANPDAGKYAVRYLSYDVWGKKRFADGVPDTSGALNNPDMYHGFTGHEMLDEVGLIHMNGRLYDPVLGRFVSADFMIQSPDNLQSYNRYTYGWNNPLAGTDPSGQIFWGWIAAAIISAEVGYQAGIIDKGTARMIQGIAVALALGPEAGAGFTAEAAGQAMMAGFAGGFVSSDGSLEGAVQGGITAGLFYGAGSFADGIGGAAAKAGMGPWVHGGIGRVMAHAAAGCAGAMASGGSCGRGAMTAGVSEGVGGNLGEHDGVIARAVLGGTVSVIGGGKFSNGAVMGAYGYLFNCSAHPSCPQSERDKEIAETLAMIDEARRFVRGFFLVEGRSGLSDSLSTASKMLDGVTVVAVVAPVVGAPVALASAGVSGLLSAGSAALSPSPVKNGTPVAAGIIAQEAAKWGGMKAKVAVSIGMATQYTVDHALK